jgi:hypothetical protein
MQINRASVAFIGFVFVAAMLLRHSTPSYAQTTPGIREELAVFSVCSQAPDAAREVSANVNAWFDNHHSARVLQRQMYTAPCPGATQFGSIAITVAIHYQQ